MRSYKKLYIISFLLCILLNISQESNLRKTDVLRNLDAVDTPLLSLTLNVLPEPVTCAKEKKTLLPLFNPLLDLDFSKLSFTVNGKSSVEVISCESPNGKVSGLNLEGVPSTPYNTSENSTSTENKVGRLLGDGDAPAAGDTPAAGGDASGPQNPSTPTPPADDNSATANSSYVVVIDFVNGTFNFSNLLENSKLVTEVKFVITSTNVTVDSLSNMFANCTNLKSVDFGNYSLEGVKDLSHLFDGCVNLANVTFSNETNTANLTTVEGMFSGCESLKLVDLTYLKFENVENATDLFNGCKNLENVTFPENGTSENLLSVEGMFAGCELMTTIDLRFFDFRHVRRMGRLFRGCKGLKHFHFHPDRPIEFVEDFSFVFEGCGNLEDVDLKTVKFDHVENMSNLFYNCSSLKNVSFPEDLNVSNVKNFDYGFAGCSSLEEFNLSIFKFEKLEKIDYLFYGAESLKTVEIGKLNCPNVKSLAGFFGGCKVLEKADFSGATFGEIESLSGAFDGCAKMTTLSLSKIKFSSKCVVKGAFGGCSLLTSLDLSGCSIPADIDTSVLFAGLEMKKVKLNLEGATVSSALVKYIQDNGGSVSGSYKIDDTKHDNSSSSNSNNSTTNSDNSTSSSSNGTSSSSNSSSNGNSTSDNSSSESSEVIKSTKNNKKSSGGLSKGATAGIVVSCVVVVVVVVVIVVVAVSASTTAAAGGAVAAATVGAVAANSSQSGFVAGAAAAAAAA